MSTSDPEQFVNEDNLLMCGNSMDDRESSQTIFPDSSEDPLWCVKVFGFNGEDSWVDMGTGITYLESIGDGETKKLILTVSIKDMNDPNFLIDRDADIDESKRIKFRGHSQDDTTILQVDLKKGLGFGKQNQTIISWYQEDIEEDLAISFQDQWACLSTFMKICNDLGQPYDSEISPPTKENLEKIQRIISNPTEEYYDQQFAAFSNHSTYLNQFYETFYQLEQECNQPELKLCALIVKTLLSSKMMVMVSILLDDKNYNHIFAMLEYDENNLPVNPKDEEEVKPLNSYRDFCDNSKHMTLPGMDPQAINFIKMRFRFIFLKDYIFAICSEELLGLLHYRLVILNTTVLECLLKGQAIKILIENSINNQCMFAKFQTEMLSLLKLSSNSALINLPQFIIDNNLIDRLIKNIQVILNVCEDDNESDSNADNDSSNLFAGNSDNDKNDSKDFGKFVSMLKEDVDNYQSLENDFSEPVLLDITQRNFFMALIELMNIVQRQNVLVTTDKLVKNKFERIFFKVQRINDASAFDILFELICPNYDPFTEPNLTLVEYLCDYWGPLVTYLNKKQEKSEIHEETNPDASKEDIKFYSRLALILNKMIKVGLTHKIVSKIRDSKIVGTLFRNCEKFVKNHTMNKYLFIQVIQQHKSILLEKDDIFYYELVESPIIFQILEIHNKKRNNQIYSQILEFFKMFHESQIWNFKQKYVLYFRDQLEKNKSFERIITDILNNNDNLDAGRKMYAGLGSDGRKNSDVLLNYQLNTIDTNKIGSLNSNIIDDSSFQNTIGGINQEEFDNYIQELDTQSKNTQSSPASSSINKNNLLGGNNLNNLNVAFVESREEEDFFSDDKNVGLNPIKKKFVNSLMDIENINPGEIGGSGKVELETSKEKELVDSMDKIIHSLIMKNKVNSEEENKNIFTQINEHETQESTEEKLEMTSSIFISDLGKRNNYMRLLGSKKNDRHHDDLDGGILSEKLDGQFVNNPKEVGFIDYGLEKRPCSAEILEQENDFNPNKYIITIPAFKFQFSRVLHGRRWKCLSE